MPTCCSCPCDIEEAVEAIETGPATCRRLASYSHLACPTWPVTAWSALCPAWPVASCPASCLHKPPISACSSAISKPIWPPHLPYPPDTSLATPPRHLTYFTMLSSRPPRNSIVLFHLDLETPQKWLSRLRLPLSPPIILPPAACHCLSPPATCHLPPSCSYPLSCLSPPASPLAAWPVFTDHLAYL